VVSDDGGDFEQWYAGEHPRLVASLLLVLGDVELAREAVDEACLRALVRWARVSRMDSPGGYVYRIALNEAWRRRRRARVEQRILARHGVEPVVPVPAGDAWELVRGLAPRQRTAVVLRYVADLTEADIAVVMGVSRGTVSSTLIDARRLIARQLEQSSEEVEGRHG
jgi:DNA-directed RNA polymerase specialized sigma24 family protein